MKAFILSSKGDREAAIFCHRHLAMLGVQSVVALDEREIDGDLAPWEILTRFPRRERIKGTECAIGIAELMAGESGVVCKVDADMLLSPDAIAWLSSANDRAHGYGWKTGRINWIGCWSAPASAMASVAEKLRAFPPCNDCGESNLMHAAFKATCGIRRFPPPAVQIWRAGRSIYSDAHVVTLPSGIPAEERAADLRELFGFVQEPLKGLLAG